MVSAGEAEGEEGVLVGVAGVGHLRVHRVGVGVVRHVRRDVAGTGGSTRWKWVVRSEWVVRSVAAVLSIVAIVAYWGNGAVMAQAVLSIMGVMFAVLYGIERSARRAAGRREP